MRWFARLLLVFGALAACFAVTLAAGLRQGLLLRLLGVSFCARYAGSASPPTGRDADQAPRPTATCGRWMLLIGAGSGAHPPLLLAVAASWSAAWRH